MLQLFLSLSQKQQYNEVNKKKQALYFVRTNFSKLSFQGLQK